MDLSFVYFKNTKCVYRIEKSPPYPLHLKKPFSNYRLKEHIGIFNVSELKYSIDYLIQFCYDIHTITYILFQNLPHIHPKLISQFETQTEIQCNICSIFYTH